MMKKQHYMTKEERYKLEGMLDAKMKKTEIAKILGFSIQTIYNEIERGTYLHTVDWRDIPRYSAAKGQDIFEKRQRNKGRPLKIGHDHEYAEYLDKKMFIERYSPAAALASARKEGFTKSLCVQTIYNYIDKGFFLRMENEHLWEKTKRLPRRKQKEEPKIAHPKLPSIEQRPEWINNRSTLGNYEMDLVVGCKGSSAILLTLTERATREEVIIKLPNRKAATIRKAFDRMERKDRHGFREKFQSLTTDNGSEFMQYEELIKSVFGGTRFDVWYTHSGCPWEKGTNENHNRIIRRFFPKGTDFEKISKKRIADVQNWMNNYPRKSLNWMTPLEASGM